MVKYKQEVYDWFLDLDAASRIDFICSIFQQCSPWELRLFGTCLEQLARKDYHVLKDFEDKANDHKELEEMTDILHQGQNIRSRLIVCMCLMRSRPPNALCAKVLYDLLSDMDNHLRILSASVPIDESLVADVRLLLSIAIHHPAFTFSQHQDFINQMEGFTHMFGQPSSDKNPSRELKDAQCQTYPNSMQYDLGPYEASVTASSPLNVKTRYGSNRTQTLKSHWNIAESCSVRSDKNKPDVYLIDAKMSDGSKRSISKSHHEIKSFHDRLVQEFPDDVKAPKNVRRIPLFKVDSSERNIRHYLKDLCKMPSKYMECKFVMDFFLDTSDQSPVDNSPLPSTGVPSAGGSTSIAPDNSNTASVGLLSSECDTLGLPTHTVIVTNSSKYTDISSHVTTGADNILLSTETRSQQTSSSRQSPLLINQPPQSHVIPPSSPGQMLLMTQEDLKRKGMVDGAAKKLAEKLDLVKRNQGQISPQLLDKAHPLQTKGVMRSQQSCDSSSSDLSSPRASPYNRTNNKTNTAATAFIQQHVQHPGTADYPNDNPKGFVVQPPPNLIPVASQILSETVRMEYDIQGSQSTSTLYCNGDIPPDISSNKLYHFAPTNSQSMSTETNLDELTVSQPGKSMSEASITIVPISPVPLGESLTRKQAPLSRPSNYQPPLMQTTESSRQNQNNPRQTSDSGIGNSSVPPMSNKTPTVKEIIERQRMQNFQRQLSQPAVTYSSSMDGNTSGQSTAIADVTARTSKSLPRHSSTKSMSHDYQQKLPMVDKKIPMRQAQHPPVQAITMQQPTFHNQYPPPTEHRNQPLVSRPPILGSGNPSPSGRHPSPGVGNNSPDFETVVDSEGSGEFIVLPDSSELSDHSELLQQQAIQRRREMAQHSIHPPIQHINQVDSIAERLENIELRPDQPPPSGGMILQQRPPYMTMDNEVQYIPASINGLKPYTFNPADGSYNTGGAPCVCPQCMPYYIAVPPPGPPPTQQPPPPPNIGPAPHQNGIIYQGFPAGFVPTSNGLISPNLPNFPRPNNNSMPQNMQRNEIIYPIQYLPPNSTRPPSYQGTMGPPPLMQVPPNYQQPQQFYTTALTYSNKKVQCTNCGGPGHTRNECPEPGDTSANINQFNLDIVPPPDVQE